jgi:hypothetical protein
VIPNLLTKDEAAKAVRVTSRTLQNLWHRNGGPVRTFIGGRVFVREDHLTAWMDACAQARPQPEAEAA